jgi:RNA polymerase sigma factor (sigma-70 family)
MAEVPEAAAPASPDGEPELWSAIRDLPPMQRAAVVYRYVLDLPYREVAEALGCSEQAARANAHEARKRLRARLQSVKEDA